MDKILRKLNWVILGIEILICLGCLAPVIVFGHGLGDLYYYILVFLMTISHLIITIIIRKIGIPEIILIPIVIFSVTTTMVCYKATVGRGPEYSWENGRIFYKWVI